MSEYVPTIGLEIHAELKTLTKMFCRCRNDADETRPNVNICPVCMAHPGTLPVVNREAVMRVLRVGAALKSALADYSEFDRKNYFYPDLPKGYQISQYAYPLVAGGELAGVAITRVHLEEDTASSMHEEGEGTTIDYNRAGVPLMELVTEPCITSAKQAGDFARELQLLLRALGASDANMEKGEMRVEANISVSHTSELGTKVEIKNLNSFRIMERAVEHEVKRQTALLERGEEVVQETRGWDEGKQATFPQRVKEGSADYRYFPDPDIPNLRLSELPECALEAVEASLPELPSQRRGRYAALGVKPEDADSYVRNPLLGNFFEQVIAGWEDGKMAVLASNYIANDMVSLLRDTGERDAEMSSEMPISARNFRKIIELLSEKKISSKAAKDLLRECTSTQKDAEQIAQEKGLFHIIDTGSLETVISKVLEANQGVALEYRHGKTVALEYLVGQAMRELRGAGEPGVVRELLKGKLSQ